MLFTVNGQCLSNLYYILKLIKNIHLFLDKAVPANLLCGYVEVSSEEDQKE